MATLIYLPVPTTEMHQFADQLQLGAKNTLRNHFVSGRGKGIARFFNGCLSGVKAWDELLLICHGNTGGSRKTGAEREDGKLKAYTPAELASVIEKEGLTKAFINLKLLVCGGALNTNLKGADCFGVQVFRALKSTGYKQIGVTAYLGNVYTHDGKIQVLRKGVDGHKLYPGNVPGSYQVFK